MKLIFLDIDGVLVPISDVNGSLPKMGCIFPEPRCVKELNRLHEMTGASVVISSTRRHYIHDLREMQTVFSWHSISAPVVGMIPESGEDWVDQSRGAEVKAFLELLEVESFVILDDCDMGWNGLEDRWVKTDCRIGLQSEDVEKAALILTTVCR